MVASLCRLRLIVQSRKPSNAKSLSRGFLHRMNVKTETIAFCCACGMAEYGPQFDRFSCTASSRPFCDIPDRPATRAVIAFQRRQWRRSGSAAASFWSPPGASEFRDADVSAPLTATPSTATAVCDPAPSRNILSSSIFTLTRPRQMAPLTGMP